MIVGEADIDVHARTQNVDAELGRDVDKIANRMGTRLGRGISTSSAQELERGTARFARSGRLLSNVFTANSAAALGPLQEVADKVDLIGSTLEQTKTKAGGALLGIGAAATGVGAFLLTVASREEAAHKRLAAAIDAQGGSIDEYETRIDRAIKAGERFGQSGNQTVDAIQALTIGLHSPAKALDELQLAEDIAATKQISLSSAADIVRQAYNGNTRVLKAFGIQVKDVVDGEKLLSDAHAVQKKATDDTANAQRAYTDKLAIYRDTLKPTLSQQIALKESHDKLLKAQQASRDAAAQVADAQRKANAAGVKGQEVLDQLAKITRGQASASADTFIGRLKGVGARIEDIIAKQHTLGTVLVSAGPLLAGAGAVIEVALTGKLLKAQRAANALRDAEVVGAGEGAAAQALGAATGETAIVTASRAEVGAIGTVVVAEDGIGVAAGVAAGEVGVAAGEMVTALGTVDTAAAGTAGAVRGIAGGLLGLPGLIATAGTAAVYELNKWYHAHPSGFYRANDPISNFLFGKRPRTPDPIDNSSLSLPGLQPRSVQTDDAYDAKTAATLTQRLGMAGQKQRIIDAAKKTGKTAGDTTLQAFLDSINGGQVANSAAQQALSKALSAAQKAAADQARALGKTVTDGMRAQLATVKQELSAVTTQRTKILDFRSSVLTAAGDFTKLSGLIDDPSTSTAARITSALSNRLLGLQTFASNLRVLARRGLDKGVIAELAQGGPDQRALSSALVQGTDAQIQALNATEKAVRAQQQNVAASAVDARFGPKALENANATLARLLAEQKHTNALLAAEPALIAKAVDAARKNAAVTTKTSTRTAVAR